MKTPKCKHNVTLDSECADCVAIKTDNTQVLINQDKKIAGLEQKLNKCQSVMADISSMCVGELTMNYKLDAMCIGEMIYQVTGMTQPELEKSATIKTDNSKVVINQAKIIENLEQKHRDSCYAWREAFDKMHQRAIEAERRSKIMGSEVDEFAKNTLMLGGEIKGLELKLDEQIAYNVEKDRRIEIIIEWCNGNIDMKTGVTTFALQVRNLLEQKYNPRELRQIKADAIREAKNYALQKAKEADSFLIDARDLEECANKLITGE